MNPLEHLNDTIVALATPPGHGGLAVIRLSGERAFEIAQAVAHPARLGAPRVAVLRSFRDDEGQIDRGLLTCFRGPGSFTGEDVAEFSVLGAPTVVERLLTRLRSLGARSAAAGEFSFRACVSGRMTLLEAEATAAVIAAESQSELEVAERALTGEFRRRIEELHREIVSLEAQGEYAVDFDEEDTPLPVEEILRRTEGLYATVSELVRGYEVFERIRRGTRWVLWGQPNVGKSSLLNALCGYSRVLVSAQAGTTRDTIEVPLERDGMKLVLVDGAGWSVAPEEIEREGISRIREEVAHADFVLLVYDQSHGWTSEDSALLEALHSERTILVSNKCDLSVEWVNKNVSGNALTVSAKTGQGIAELWEVMSQRSRLATPGETICLTSARQRDKLDSCRKGLSDASLSIRSGASPEIWTESLRQARHELEMLVEIAPDRLYEEIFSRFCVGK